MTSPRIPHPIHELVRATNDGDSAAFIALFTDDARIEDFGRTFDGREGAASWNETDNIGVGAQFDLRGVRAGSRPDEYLVDVEVTSGRFNGASTLVIGVAGERIASLVTS